MNLCTFVKGTRYSCKDVTRCAEPEFAVCQNMFWDSAGHLLLASEVSYGAHVNYLTCWEARGYSWYLTPVSYRKPPLSGERIMFSASLGVKNEYADSWTTVILSPKYNGGWKKLKVWLDIGLENLFLEKCGRGIAEAGYVNEGKLKRHLSQYIGEQFRVNEGPSFSQDVSILSGCGFSSSDVVGVLGANRYSAFVREFGVFTIIRGEVFLNQPEMPCTPIYMAALADFSWRVSKRYISLLDARVQIGFEFSSIGSDLHLPKLLYDVLMRYLRTEGLLGQNDLVTCGSSLPLVTIDFRNGYVHTVLPEDYLQPEQEGQCKLRIRKSTSEILLLTPIVLKQMVVQYDNTAGRIGICPLGVS